MSESVLALFNQWERTVNDLLTRTEAWPRNLRYTLTIRTENLALDILELIVVARYKKGRPRQAALNDANLKLTRLRILTRLAHTRRILSDLAFEHLSRQFDDAGRMIGGWLKQTANPLSNPSTHPDPDDESTPPIF